MKLISIGNRNNLLYPLVLMILIVILKLDTTIFGTIKIAKNESILLSLNTLSTLLFSSISLIILNLQKNKLKAYQIENKIIAKKKHNDNNELISKESTSKIIILIFFSGFFNLAVILGEQLLTIKIPLDLLRETKIRSIEICISALLSYFYLRIELNKHHKVSLFIIFSLVFIIIFYLLIKNNFSSEFFFVINDNLYKYLQSF